MPDPAQLTAAEISRLAGVTRATVSNWRRRHPDFPTPSGGTESSPAYDVEAVRAWLAARGQLPADSPADDLRTALRADADPQPLRLLPLVLASGQMTADDLRQLTALPDDALAARLRSAVQPHLAAVPGVADPGYQDIEADLLRTVLRCVAASGGVQTAEILAEYEPDDATSGNYRTPTELNELMADLLAIPGESYPVSVFDPACGDGGLLIVAGTRGAAQLYGQDIIAGQAALAAVRIALRTTATRVTVRSGDSMRADAFPSLTVDAVLCAPPYGDREWGHEDLAYDARWMFALPAKSEPELAWLQHCLSHTREGGRVIVLMPPATAERAAGRRIRANLVRSGTLRAVVALSQGAAPPLHIGLHLWLLQRPSAQATAAHNVLFIDTTDPDRRRTGDSPTRRPVLNWTALSGTVLDIWRDYDQHPETFDPVPGTARAVPIVDLLDETVDLTPARHVRAASAPEPPDEVAVAADATRDKLRDAAADLATLSAGESWQPAGSVPRDWRQATVADLLRGGALILVRSPIFQPADRRHRDTTSAGRNEPPKRNGTSHTKTLTATDVLTRGPASGPAEWTGAEITIKAGDIILPEILHHGATARVADEADARQLLGRHLHLLRPDPARFNPWFLAGFLGSDRNLNAAASGTSIVRIDVRRLRIPLLPPAEQQAYAEAFRRLHAIRVAADLANRLADDATRMLGDGLTDGAILPPHTAT
jgi:hypothetical protein